MERLKKKVVIEWPEDDSPHCCLDEETVAFLGQEIVLALGIGREIQIFRKKQWDTMLERLKQMPASHAKHFRLIIANSAACDLSDGRMQLPELLLDYAAIKDEAFLVAEDDAIILVSPTHIDTALEQIRNKGVLL